MDADLVHHPGLNEQRVGCSEVEHPAQQRSASMPRITVGTENGAPIEIHYEDHGE